MVYTCDETSPPYYEGIYNALGECIHKGDGLKIASFVLGWCSIGCWLVAQVPQVVKSIILKNVESVSPLLFVNWFIGDISNLLGIIFTKGLVTQLASGVYYMFIDSLCVFVNFFFRYCYKRKDKKKEKDNTEENEGSKIEMCDVENKDSSVDSSSSSSSKSGSSSSSNNKSDKSSEKSKSDDSSSSSSTSSATGSKQDKDSDNKIDIDVEVEGHKGVIRPTKDLVLVVILAIIRFGMCKIIDDEKNMESVSGESMLLRQLAGTLEGGVEEEENQKKTPLYIAGEVLGYVSCVMYLAARLPQIIHNAKKHDVTGLAPAMFILAFIANLFYATSILLGAKVRRII